MTNKESKDFQQNLLLDYVIEQLSNHSFIINGNKAISRANIYVVLNELAAINQILRPCPFCGSKDIQIFENEGATRCRCYACFSSGTDFDNRNNVYRGKEATKRAIEAWNKRA